MADIPPESRLTAPSKSGRDDAMDYVIGWIGALPILGSPIAATTKIIAGSHFQKKHELWMAAVSNRLNILLESNIINQLSELESNEHFQSMLYRATQQSIRINDSTHRNALLEAVVASATNLDQLREQLYIGFLESLSSLHLKYLVAIIKNENRAVENILPSTELLDLFKAEELGGDEILMSLLSEELETAKFLIQHRSIEGCDPTDMFVVLSSLGRDFVEFVNLGGTNEA